MKIRKNVLTLSLALAAILGLAGMANAQNHMMGGAGMAGGHAMGAVYNLPPEKQAAVQKLYSEHNLATEPLRQQLFAKQSELNVLYYSGSTDTAKVQTLSREIGELNGKLYSAQVNLRKQLAKEGVPASGMGHGMGMNHGMGGMGMGGMGMGHGMASGGAGMNCW